MPINYQAHEWKDGASGGTPIDAESLNRIEQGVADACAGVDSLTDHLEKMSEPGYVSTEALADGAVTSEKISSSVMSSVNGSSKAVSKSRTVCGSKVVSVNNSGTFVLFQSNELSSLASSVGGNVSTPAIAVTNGDWNSTQVKIVATLIQNNAALCYLEKAITGSVRVNYAATFSV